MASSTAMTMRLREETLTKLRGLLRPGETMDSLIGRSLDALIADQSVDLLSPVDGQVTPSRLDDMESRIAVLENRLVALETTQLTYVHGIDTVPEGTTITPVHSDDTGLENTEITPEYSSTRFPHPFIPGEKRGHDPYPIETKKLAIEALQAGKIGSALSRIIYNDCGKDPGTKSVKALVNSWVNKGI